LKALHEISIIKKVKLDATVVHELNPETFSNIAAELGELGKLCD
jgi:hypothetical protein